MIPVFVYFVLSWVSTYWAVAFCALFFISRAFNGVVVTDFYNQEIPGNMRATANSFTSFAFRAGFAVLGPIAGLLIDRYNIFISFAFFGVLFLALGSFSTFKLLRVFEYKKSAHQN